MNPNDTFFEGYYKDIWKTLIPDELTVKEVDFMVSYFGLKQGSRVLDMMCGYGRHALALAKKGIEVTAIDNLEDYIEEIRIKAREEEVPVHAIQQSILDYKSVEQFDLAICMGNSLQFFNRHDIITILKNVRKSMKPGGQLFINSWSIAEIAIRNFKDRSWSQIGDMKFLVESTYYPSPSRIEIHSIILTPTGETEEKDSVDYIYSLNEMESMMQEAGLKLKEVYSIPGKKKFTIGEVRAYLVCSL